MRENPDALACWRELWPLLRGRLAREDLLAFADMTLCHARLRAAERIIADEGLTAIGRNGEAVKHPACTIARQYREDFQRWADRFGLAPGARGRLPAQQEEGPSIADMLWNKVAVGGDYGVLQ